MARFAFAFLGLPKSAEVAARSMLRLLLPMLGGRWQMTEAADADVVILPAAALCELNRANAARPGALYVVFEEAGPLPPNAFGTTRRPLNSGSLVEVLHRAQTELERRKAGSHETTYIAAGLDKDSTELRGIRTSMRTAVRWVLQDRSNAVSVMSPRQARIFSVLPDRRFSTRLGSSEIAGLIRADGEVILLILNEAEQADLLNKPRRFEPLLKLEWIYWLAGSNGGLRPELNTATPYRLRRWPDFSRLPHYRADVRMASLLKADALTIGELAERAGVRFETACNFVNACWALNFLVAALEPPVAEQGPPTVTPAPSERDEPAGIPVTLLGSLRRVFGLAQRSPRGA